MAAKTYQHGSENYQFGNGECEAFPTRQLLKFG